LTGNKNFSGVKVVKDALKDDRKFENNLRH